MFSLFPADVGGGAEPRVLAREREERGPVGSRHRRRQPDLQRLGRHGPRPGDDEKQEKEKSSLFYQGEMVDSIEANVESASIRVNEGSDQLRMAERYQVRFGEQSCHLLNLCLSCEPAFQVFYLPFISNLL